MILNAFVNFLPVKYILKSNSSKISAANNLRYTVLHQYALLTLHIPDPTHLIKNPRLSGMASNVQHYCQECENFQRSKPHFLFEHHLLAPPLRIHGKCLLC